MKFPSHKNQSLKRSSVLGWGFFGSIALHLLLLFFTISKANSYLHESTKEIPIELSDIPKELLDPSKQSTVQNKIQKPPPKEQQIVETEDAKNRELNPDTRFLGEHNQNSKIQTRAQNIDDFRQKEGTGSKGQSLSKEKNIPPTGDTSSDTPPKEDILADTDGLMKKTDKTNEKLNKGIKRNWKTLSLTDLSVGGDGKTDAASDDRLNGIDSAERTILSTREFKFFSYYHRIKELLRQYWKPNVERQLSLIWNKGRSITSEELTTRVLVLLDEKGGIQKISKISSSGFSELDQAAIEAFQRAAPFPNPPHALVEDDGFVRINWDFILTTDNGPRIQFRTVGNRPNN